MTGADPYYCAGVNLSDSIKPMHPKKLHNMIVTNNQAVFDSFLDFPKPIIIAANGKIMLMIMVVTQKIGKNKVSLSY